MAFHMRDACEDDLPTLARLHVEAFNVVQPLSPSTLLCIYSRLFRCVHAPMAKCLLIHFSVDPGASRLKREAVANLAGSPLDRLANSFGRHPTFRSSSFTIPSAFSAALSRRSTP